MRKKKWQLTAIALTFVLLTGTVLMANLTGISVTPNPIVVGNGMQWTWTDDGNPQLSGDHVSWRMYCNSDCVGCPPRPWGAYTCMTWLGDFSVWATATWNVPDPNNPYGGGQNYSQDADVSVHVIGPDLLTESFPNGNFGNYQFPNTYVRVLLQIKVTAGGQPLGQCAAPTVEERIYRSLQWGGRGWEPWSGTNADIYWDAATSSIMDFKVRGTGLQFDQNGNRIAAGTKIDEALQVIRLTFPSCDGGTSWIRYKAFKFQTWMSKTGPNFVFAVKQMTDPAPPFPPGT